MFWKAWTSISPKIRRGIAVGVIAAAIFSLCLIAWGAGSSPGTKEDPAVTLSYLTDVFEPAMLSAAAADVAAKTADVKWSGYSADITAISTKFSKAYTSVLVAPASKNVYAYLTRKRPVLEDGALLRGEAGTVITVSSGQVKIRSDALDLTTGQTLSAHAKIPLRHEIMFLQPTICESVNRSAEINVRGRSFSTDGYRANYTDIAYALKDLDIFKGYGNDYFGLEHTVSRIEALVLLLRLLGKEADALAFKGKNPFTDVIGYYERYAAYAYAQGIVLGIGNNKYSPESPVGASDFMTMILRAMGYSSAKDFNYRYSLDFARTKGIITQNEREWLRTTEMKRDHVVYQLWFALDQKGADGASIKQKLIKAGKITETLYARAAKKVKTKRI